MPSRDTTSSDLPDRANALWRRFTLSDRHEDPEKVISFHRKSLKQRSASRPDRHIYLVYLASALSKEFEHLGRSEDLDEATLLYRQMLELLLTSHSRCSIFLNNLARVLSARFTWSGRRHNPKAISLNQQALELTTFKLTHFATVIVV